MAEVAAIVVPIIQPLIEELSSGVWREMKMICSVEKDLEKLKKRLETINSVLVDAERRSVSDVALRGWLRDIKDAAFEADDVVDGFQTEALRRSHLINLNVKGKVRDFFSSNNLFLFLNKMAREIKDVNNRIDGLVQLSKDFNLNKGSSPPSSSEVALDRETCSSVDESKICGREEDKEHIINLLLNEDQDKNLSVLPIVGLGGLGKTTLAQLVYNDVRVQGHFDMKKWVFVGKKFKILNIINAIEMDTSASTLETARQCLLKKLGGQRFLLVLDDVWNENRVEWERLEDLLKCGKPGSKIVVTTRSEGVAKIMLTTEHSYKMKGLSDDKCWDLFRMIAFGPGRAVESPGLIEIGNEIVKKCGGLPLAVKSLGGLMASKLGEHEWLVIRNSEIWDLPFKDVEDVPILPSLILSYDHLPSNLKQCFAYCSLFPKDHVFGRWELIQFWIAEGFIQSSREEVHIEEDIGSKYFNILLERSFLQNEWVDLSGDISYYKMHDLVHDLACLVSKGEFSTVHATEDKISLTGRYSSVIYNAYMDKLALHIVNEAKKLRSLHVLGAYRNTLSEFELGPLSLVTHIRVLNLSGIRMTVVPKIVGKLKHLRFLDISSSPIKELPKSVCSLYNLQTLNLRYCTSLERLPKGIENLWSLRHLDIEGCNSLTHMPSGIGRLTALQTLPLFVVDERCHISELQNLKSIRGEFTIKIRSRMDPREAKDANLGAKPNIHLLVLEWRRDPSFEDEEGAVENVRPHPNLKHLCIYGYPGSRLPNWLGEASVLPNLKKLFMVHLDSCESLPSLGQLPSLEHLDVKGMPRLRRMGEEVYGDDGGVSFPALKSLELWNMDDLEEWLVVARNDIIMFPLLEELVILECPKLRLPNWVASLGQLKKLVLRKLDRWESLPSLGQLPCLEHLEVTHMPRPRRMGEEVYGDDGGVLFPALKSLSLEQLPDLEEWLVVARNGIIMFPLLEELNIRDCPKWRLPNWVASHGQLKKLSLWNLDSCESLPSLGQLPSLEHLVLSGMPRLRRMGEEVYGDDGVFPALKYLRLDDLDDLEEWLVVARHGITMFPLLEELEICDCPKLRLERAHLPSSLVKLEMTGIDEELLSAGVGGILQGLSRLTDLEIEGVKPSSNSSTEWKGIQHLTALEKLEISECDGLTKLPEGVLQLPSLQSLELCGIPRLNSLGQRRPLFYASLLRLTLQDCDDLIALPEWVGDLTSLRDLSLLRCPKLEQLPDELQRLTGLQRLHINNCHLLKSRCEKVTGEDWNKIAHIPSVEID